MPQKKIDAPNACLTCGTKFQIYRWQLARGWGKFCCVSCGSKSRTKERNGAWKGDNITYEAVHFRLLAAKGPATNYVCTCGETAAEWAYSHQDVNQVKCPKGRPYSTNLSYYAPKCRHCHRLEDLNRDASKPVPVSEEGAPRCQTCRSRNTDECLHWRF